MAVARNGSFVAKVSNLGAPKSVDVLHAIGGHCEAESVLCTDGGRPGQRLASFEGLECIPIKGGKGSKGIYNIQRVNAFHPGLKGMVNIRFHGVATKYLNNYVAWYGFMHAKAMPAEEREAALYEIALFATCPTTTRNLSQRNAIPVLSKQQQRLMTAILLELSSEEAQDRQETSARFLRNKRRRRPNMPTEKPPIKTFDKKPKESTNEDIPF